MWSELVPADVEVHQEPCSADDGAEIFHVRIGEPDFGEADLAEKAALREDLAELASDQRTCPYRDEPQFLQLMRYRPGKQVAKGLQALFTEVVEFDY